MIVHHIGNLIHLIWESALGELPRFRITITFDKLEEKVRFEERVAGELEQMTRVPSRDGITMTNLRIFDVPVDIEWRGRS